MLKEFLPRANLFKPAFKAGSAVRPLLSKALQDKLQPARHAGPGRRASMRARCWCWTAACSRRWRRTSTPPPRACSMRSACS
jgi:hypothetical protein